MDGPYNDIFNYASFIMADFFRVLQTHHSKQEHMTSDFFGMFGVLNEIDKVSYRTNKYIYMS